MSTAKERTNMKMGTGPRLYEKAKRLIPGGVHLYSKRPERFLPVLWPAYYSRSKGNYVWDLDGRRYVDMLSAGCGTCLLGSADPDVDRAVRRAIRNGSMSTLNPPEEVELAEMLCRIHPWADMVRFARGGGEVCAVAVRIARSFTDKDKVVVCGYHGWHDWYIAANRSSDPEQDGQAIPGMKFGGVPRALAGTTLTFRYNEIEEFRKVVSEHGREIGVIMMEPMRFDEPKEGFLEEIRRTATELGAVLIFDEINIGFPNSLGGIHLELGVEPDMATFAKVISNGYPMAAVLGRGEIMEAMDRSFISSSYFTERVGPAAGVATLKKMERVRAQEHAARIGLKVQEEWGRAVKKHGLPVTCSGRPAFCTLNFEFGEQSEKFRTLYTQEMLDRGFIAATSFYPNYTLTDKIIGTYFSALDEVFAVLADARTKGDVEKRIRSTVAQSDFGRLM